MGRRKYILYCNYNSLKYTCPICCTVNSMETAEESSWSLLILTIVSAVFSRKGPKIINFKTTVYSSKDYFSCSHVYLKLTGPGSSHQSTDPTIVNSIHLYSNEKS